jgi:Phytanoyl-CoA dioxygenase (PhyH)
MTDGEPGHRTDFIVNDQVSGYPVRTVETTASDGELDALVRSGYLVIRGLVDGDTAATLAEGVLRLASAEAGQPGSEYLEGESIYIRGLLDKDPVFHPLVRLEPALSIARSLLGPQVWIDLEARLNYAGCAGVAVPWHGHLPVIPDPQPAWFCYPHQVHCLVYLDRITEAEGALCLLPGSHTDPDVQIPLGDGSSKDGEVRLFFQPGDAVLVHGNLWHRTAPSRQHAGYRRLLLLGYVPAWIRNDIGDRGVRAARPLRADLALAGDSEMRELLGEFNW